jgi:uncharacterized protein HemX
MEDLLSTLVALASGLLKFMWHGVVWGVLVTIVLGVLGYYVEKVIENNRKDRRNDVREALEQHAERQRAASEREDQRRYEDHERLKQIERLVERLVQSMDAAKWR